MGAAQSTIPMSEIDFDTYRGLRYSKEVPGSRNAHQGPIYVTGQLPDVVDAEQTVYHAFLRGCAMENGTRPFYGTRRIENGVAGAYEWVTYGEVQTRVDAIASGLTAACGLKRQDMVAIFAKNRMEWCLTSHATDRMAYALVPLYDTLGPDAVPYILNHTEATVLVAGADQFSVILESKDECPKLQFVIQFEDVTDEQRRLARAKNLELKSFREIEALGRSRPLPADMPLPDDVSTICYTSGTTGNPKGVVLTHRNVAVVTLLTEDRLRVSPTDVHISYLPLPHVFERATLTALMRSGAAIGFYQGDVLFLMDDMATLAPTLFVSVPRLFNRVYDKIVQGVAAAGGLKKLLFDQGFASKKAALAGGHKTHAFWDALVFSKIRMVLGGRVRLILSGSAPLAAEVKDFLKIVMSCDVIEGYGLSETAAALTVASADMPLGPHVGPPIVNVEVRLEDVPEMGYTSHDKPRPRGEVLMRGPNLFAGYYKEPEKTAEAVDADGWFHTGDIGCWNADGTLSIVDRKKNIFKLSQGEYVAAEKIEGVYLKSKFVAQIFVHGDSLQSHLVGIVVPDPEVAEAWAASNGLTNERATVAALASNAAFQQAVLEDMNRTGKDAQLRGFEFVKHVHFHPEPFSMDAGLITPTFKLKRPQLKAFFEKQILDLYAKE